MMTKDEKRYYYLLLSICLIASFSQNYILWMLTNPIFPMISIYFYYKIREPVFLPKDSFIIASLCCAAVQEIFIAQRHDKSSLLFGILFLFLMFVFFILSIRQEKKYLLIGRKNMLAKSMFIIITAIICYVCFFLPIICYYLLLFTII